MSTIHHANYQVLNDLDVDVGIEHISSRLNALEWSVVRLARNDGLSTLTSPGQIIAALGIVFGRVYHNRLADPRLEALRRLSVIAWRHDGLVDQQEAAALVSAGFDELQLDAVLAGIRHQSAHDRQHGAS